MHTGEGLSPFRGDVAVLRWPEQEEEARQLERLGRPLLLLVEPGASPPALQGCTSDWMRLPMNDVDMRARLHALAARSVQHPTKPAMGGHGELSFRGNRVFLSPTDERLTEELVRAFDRGVSETHLFASVWNGDGDSSKLRVHVSRLRKRIEPLGLEISSIRGFGYRLHDASARAADATRGVE